MRAVKIFGLALGAVVALLAVAAALIASFFDPNDYKGVATDAFTARTGRTLAIDQDLRLSFFPWLAVETGGITVGNAAGFGGPDGAEPFATVERVAARVRILPLLARRIEIGTVELDGLRLNLARDAERKGNWQDLVDAASVNAQSGAGGAALEPVDSSTPAVGDFSVGGVRIRRGAIYWHENTTELRYTVSGLDLTTGSIGRSEPVTIDVALEFRDALSGLAAKAAAAGVAEIAPSGSVTASDLEAKVTLAAADGAPAREVDIAFASLTFDRNAQTLEVQELTTEVAGVRASWQLHGSALLDNPSVTGTIAVADASLAEVFEQLGWRPPEGVEPAELGDFSLASEFAFQAEPREVRVAGVDAQLLGVRIRGDGTLRGSDELAGRVEIPTFQPTKAVQSLLSSTVPPTVDLSALHELALSARFDTNLSTGRAAINDLRAEVFGATITGELAAIPGDRGNVFRGAVATSRFAPDAFAKAFAAMLPKQITPSELGMVEIKGEFALDGGADTLTVPSFEAELFGLKAAGELTGKGVSTNATWTGRARVAQFSPQDLIQRFGLPPQPTSDARALTRATVDTRFAVDARNAHLAELELALDESRITGDFEIGPFDDPQYRFTLAVDAVDADRYLPPKARDAQPGEATAGDIELPANNTMKLDGTMQIGELRLAGMRFEGVGSRILIGNGNAKLENARAHLYGGDFSGNFEVRAAGSEPGLALDGRATGLQLEPLIEALTGHAANFSGAGSFDLNLAGHGRSVIENVQTASGNVAFELANGAIKGFDLGRTICAAWNVTQGAPGPAGEDAKRTVYEAIKGTATVADGSAHSSDLLARTSFMDIFGSGTLGLVDQRLDYDLDAKLTGSIDVPNCATMDKIVGESIPFDIRGTVTEPSITPDFSKIVQRVIRDQVQDRLEDRLKDRIRDLIR
jgi:AsmA protein